ncbi:hypothetical protein GO730_27340 [Spirosoma sp. HMF3257]|uniref:Uncharacterized protein n=1 Tax=Spirosoma telluris TaxID=2183553 RepID=A0A327NQG0_9BACT|nr:hypothetical protein [Spirosoma telluris]RAI76955.1 hypothetical protein HMF3257_27265 [Spirosoma telluris]
MNQENSTVLSSYEASAEEIQKVIMDWARATEAFHGRYAKLNQVINSLQTALSRQPKANRARLRQLIDLREHMSDVLMTLLLDMSGKKSGRSMQSSKPGQLHSHASLLDELNRKIDAELISFTTVAQA